MATSLSNFVNNLLEGILVFKDDLIEYKCLCCNKSYHKSLTKNWKNDSSSLTTIYCCYCMTRLYDCTVCMIGKHLMKHYYLKKKILPSLKYGRYYWCRLRACRNSLQDFEVKNIGEYHDLYVQSNTLLLSDVSENFQNMCLEIYQLDPEKFIVAPRLSWQAALKKTKVKLDLLLVSKCY